VACKAQTVAEGVLSEEHVGVGWPQLADEPFERAAVQRFGSGEVALSVEQVGQTTYHNECVRMLRLERFFENRERALVERSCAG
jgi:hypothetical protein